MTEETFSVVRFLVSGHRSYVVKNKSPDKCILAVEQYMDTLATNIGIIDRILIVNDNGDINFEWKWKEGMSRWQEGIVFPRKQ